jgi:hypothetical protein
MGAWGPGIFEDDVAADVQAMWEDARGRGDSSESAPAVAAAREQVLAALRDRLNQAT